MLKKMSLLLLGTILGLAAAAAARAGDEPDVLVEIPVQVALAPRAGFDDNDLVDVVLHGNLPNSCYHVAHSTFEPSGEGTIRVRQFAIMSHGGQCYDKDALPPYLKAPVPFTTTLALGRLAAGDYVLRYEMRNGMIGNRPLNVAKAVAPTIDNFPYAATTSAVARDHWSTIDDVTVTVSGLLNSSCVELSPNVQVTRQKDVFVVLPLIRPILTEPEAGGLCLPIVHPFTVTLNLGKLPPGHFLVHVRAMAGNSVNKAFEVSRCRARCGGNR